MTELSIRPCKFNGSPRCSHITDTSILDVHIGHFLTYLFYVLDDADFAEVVAHATVRLPRSELLNSDGMSTGEVVPVTSPDQVVLAGTLKSGVFVNIHVRAGLPAVGAHGAGRKLYQWIIDGEEGSIEVVNPPTSTDDDPFFNLTEKDVYLNGKKVDLEETEVDQLGQPGKAWLEFAKGDGENGGRYTTIQDAVRIQRVLKAARKSIDEGKKIDL